MVKNQKVKVISIYYTTLYCGRHSQYNVGDIFTIHNVSKNPRGEGLIISDDDYNFVHEKDVICYE